MRRTTGLCLAFATVLWLVLPASAWAAGGASLIGQHATIHATADACAGGTCDTDASEDNSDEIGDLDGSVSANANVTGAFGFGEAQQVSKVSESDGSLTVSTESDIDFSVGGSASDRNVSGTASSVLSLEFKVVGIPVSYFVTGSFEEPADTSARESVVELKCDGTSLVRISSDDRQSFSETGTIGAGETCLLNVDGHGSTTDAANSDGGLNLGFGAEPAAEPIIFIHGFIGSKILCGSQELWPNLPKPNLAAMNLESDGRTNAGCPSAGPAAGQLFETALGSDVYKSTIDFLHASSADVHLYAWDWRKSPEEAVAGLDALINQVRRPPDGKVVLMAHSAGGLVVRSYVDDPARAAKVSRALTVATPYWGSPKSLFPFLYGVESPDVSTLDLLLDNEEFKDFARYLQGMFFLWPSARYGGWLSIEDQPSPLKTKALLDFVEDQGGNRSLLATALGAHAARLDDLRTNGVDYQTVVGSGLHTIGAVEIKDTPLLSRDLVEVDWVNGDGTVPLTSARAATPAARQHFVCGISHVPLPGNPTLDLRVRDFLLEGEPVNDAFPVSGSLCEPEGFALSIFSLPGVAFPSSAAGARSSTAGALSLDQAEQAGLLEALNTGAQIEAATSTKAPLSLALKTKGAALRIAPMTGGKVSKARVYGPLRPGEVTIDLGSSASVSLNGRKQKGHPDDTRRPRTRVSVGGKGRRATLRFKVIDSSPVTTYVKVGKRIRRVGRTLQVPAAKLRKGVTVQSIDAFGNAEKPKKVR